MKTFLLICLIIFIIFLALKSLGSNAEGGVTPRSYYCKTL